MMKKGIFLLIFLPGVFGSMVWFGCSGKEDISQYTPVEVPVSVDGDRELKSICKKIADAAGRKNFRSLEKYFNISREDRALIKFEQKRDPVKEQLELLSGHAQLLKEDKWQVFTMEKNGSVRILRVETGDAGQLSIVLVKRKKGYRISAVKLG